jgi:hypothetical protein
MLGVPNEPLPGQIMRASDAAAQIRYAKQATLRSSPGHLIVTGSGAQTVRRIQKPTSKQWPLGSGAQAFTFELYKKIIGNAAFLQVNGDDGLEPALNGIIARVNSNPANVKIGSPAAWPLLSISSDGPVYAYVTLVTTTGITTVTQVDIYQEGSAQTPLTDAMTYAWILLGSVTDYTTSESGVPDYTLLNAQSTGFSQFQVCNGGYMVW